MKTVFARLLSCGMALLATGAIPQKEAWKWTPEERMDARFAQTRPADAGGDRSVTGKDNPELLLPTELFRTLVDLTVVPEDPKFRAHFQEKFRIRAKAANLGDDFLEVMEATTRDYVSERVRVRRLSKADLKAGAEAQYASSLALCALVTRGLSDLRKRYGAEAFDRFLYTAVAPETNVSTDMNRDRLLFMERGCS
ncbi:MAG: hypothetical protein H7X85_05355 [Thermoanaerobaculia bacterium]|nr:hypothetical protein [Thermoanaerobaculia bacterium]